MKNWTIPSLLGAAALASAATITVDPTATQQKVVGFGAASVYYQSWVTAMPADLQKDFYDTAFTGLNLSLLRIGNWKQEDTTSIADDVTIVKAGKERLGNHMKIEMSSWSAPGRLKPSGSVNGNAGHTKAEKTLNKSTSDPYGNYAYSEFAHWWKTSYQTYEQFGIAPDYISIQNEPDMEASYEETLFEPSETDEIAGYKEALQAVRDSMSTLEKMPKIIGPEPLGIGYSNFEKYASVLDQNNLDGYSYHLYHAGDNNDDPGQNYLNPENYTKSMSAIAKSYGSDDKPIIMTEFCTMQDAVREQDMLGLAHIMQVGFTSGKLGGYIAWMLFWGGPQGQLIGVCPGEGWGEYCKKGELYINPEYHAMRHYSKFVNPGWRVISATSDDKKVYTVAFRSADCDSVTVIAINKNTAATNMTAPIVKDYEGIYAIQSIESGDKSKEVAVSTDYSLPAASITTFVYALSKNAAIGNCEDSPVEDPYEDPTSKLADTVVIVDFENESSAGTWSSDSTLGAVEFMTTALDGKNKYVKVPLAGCSQDECGYQHALYTLPDMAISQKVLTTCKELVFTVRSMDDAEAASVNIGGAGGSSWSNYKYGNDAPALAWADVSVPLDNELDSTGLPYGSTQISFNSDNAGLYIAKIAATGCAGSDIGGDIGNDSVPKAPDSDAIANKFRLQENPSEIAKLFDMNGNIVWQGKKSEAIGSNGKVKLNIRKGFYILKTRGNNAMTVKK